MSFIKMRLGLTEGADRRQAATSCSESDRNPMSKIRPRLKRLRSPDIFDLESFSPGERDCFGFLRRAMFGAEEYEWEGRSTWLCVRRNG